MRKLILTGLLAALPMVALADDTPEEAAVEARQGYFLMLAKEMGVLAPMVRGEAEYNAEAATLAANNLAALAKYDLPGLFLPNTAQGQIDDTGALPAIWEKPEDFQAKFDGYVKGAEAVAAVAGDGKDALVGAFGQLGGSCKACHDDYRAKGN
ncbi:MAG: cytochrome c [Paracoccus sp. (in: a-proteobacteria)]|uniref:c-type cytochrome n=1 Tax=Paracoccus sp. TaxID=267 RepID=UPI0026DEAC53|nr:cytochrome c [Paracoccus sp. (in: a-proteobacteria)]MDO5620493.1 cytochrome c [Paracoccus sp. (in: a-proteobacteria)]